MARLSIYLLGPLRVFLEGQPVAGFESDKVRALLAYLAAEPGRPHRREALAGLLWPDRSEKSARACLRSALTNLRQVIDEPHAVTPCLIIDRQSICFNPASDVWVDVKAISELLVARAAAEYPVQRLEKAVEIYQGRFLEEFFVPCSSAFEEWALLHRERLHRQMVSLLQRLAAYYEDQNDQDKALRFAWRLVELDSWREESQRRLMRLLASSGQRAAALAQYEACRLSLARELGVEPAPETTLLYVQIRDGEPVERRRLDSDRAHPQIPRESLASIDRTYRAWREKILDLLPAHLARAIRTRKDRPSRRIAVGGLVLVAGVLLFGLFAIVLFLRSVGIPTRDPASPGMQSAQIPPKSVRGKIVLVCEQSGPRRICIRDTRTNKITQIATQDFTEIGYPSWSPDGEKIVFCAGKEAVGWSGHHLFLMNDDGSNLQQIHKEGFGINPVWSPNGEWIAFIGEGGLWMMRSDGLEERMLVEGFEWGKPRTLAWSPDSRQIVYVSRSTSGYAEVWTIQPDSQDLSLVREIDDCFDIVQAGWSADGQQVGVYCLSPERELFFVMNADGSGELETVAFLDDWFHYYWPRWERAQ